jgi:arginase
MFKGHMKKIETIYASIGEGAQVSSCKDGPLALEKYVNQLPYIVETQSYVKSNPKLDTPIDTVESFSIQLADLTERSIDVGNFPFVIGGDHSSAIGTWSGIATALKKQGDIGLIWIDAHLDSHTPETSETQAIHGMPLAALLGYGYASLVSVANAEPKLKPENVVIIGARSYEEGEHEFLKELGVKIFYMEDVNEFGLEWCFNEALHIVGLNTVGYGISLDIDALDLKLAPGVGSPVPGGISLPYLLDMFDEMPREKLIGFEMVEYNPHLDVEDKTATACSLIMQSIIR